MLHDYPYISAWIMISLKQEACIFELLSDRPKTHFETNFPMLKLRETVESGILFIFSISNRVGILFTDLV